MRHLVLAIAAIAVAQIAFQLYVIDGPQPEYAASAVAGAWPADTIVTVRGDLDPPREAVRPIAARISHRKPAKFRAQPVRAAYRPPAPRMRPVLTAKATVRKPNIVPRPDGPARQDEDDGKPWIAKALPIVKKPWSWIKTLGAKLK